MRKGGLGIAVTWFVFSAAVTAVAQEKEAPKHTGKAGLWEVTTTMTWQKAPAVRTGVHGGPPAAGSHTTSVCLTQAMVDAGALLPQSRGECYIQNKVVKPGSLTANYVCTGKMKGMGSLESNIPDLEHVNGSIHFVGTLLVDQHSEPIEWTATSNALFKSAQCANNPAPAAPANPSK
jgi:hypothetical protein